jgi:hypothetical protein
MPGAGSPAANYLYEVAPRRNGARRRRRVRRARAGVTIPPHDAANTVGRVATNNNIFMRWHTAKVQSLDDAKRWRPARRTARSIAETVPRLLNALIGTKFKLISGYPASSEAMLAMGAARSRRVVVMAAVKVGKQAWLHERKIRIILQTTPERIAELPQTPSLGEISDTPRTSRCSRFMPAGRASDAR